MGSARWLFVAEHFSALPEAKALKDDYRVMVELREGLAGAWTEHREGEELIAFGYPAGSGNKWFQPFRVLKGRHNVLSLALERMIFARRITTLVICDCSIAAVALKGAAIHQPQLIVHSRNDGEAMGAFFSRVLAA